MKGQALHHNAGHVQGPPVTLVSGASSGIGRALAIRLAARGDTVIALSRNGAALRALAAEHPGIEPLVADLGNLAAIPDLARSIAERWPGLACLVNNAGTQDNRRFDEAGYTASSIRAELDLNLAAPLLLTHGLLPVLGAQPQACVVNISSGLAYAPKRTSAVYSASKGGLRLFTEALRVQLRGSRVRVVEAVMPLVDTPMTRGRGRGKLSPDEAARQLVQGLSTGRSWIGVGKARWVGLMSRLAPGLLARILQSA